MSNNLKILAGQIISETKLSKEIKIQLLNFIQKEASDSQIKALLMDGKIVQLDEQAEEIVNDRFKNHKTSQLTEDSGKTSSILGLVASPAAWLVYRGIRAAFDKNSRKCGALKIGNERIICLLKLKIEQSKKLISSYTLLLNTHKDNPTNVKAIKKAIEMEKTKINKNEKKLDDITKK